jgi:hypothetical protein
MSGTMGAGLNKSRGVRLTRFFLRESNFAFLKSMAWRVVGRAFYHCAARPSDDLLSAKFNRLK